MQTIRSIFVVSAIILAATCNAQVLKIKPGMSVDDVKALFKDANVYLDSSSFEKDPEGNPLLSGIDFVPVEFGGALGELSIYFDGNRRVDWFAWSLRAPLTSTLTKAALADPRVKAMTNNGKRVQFDAIVRESQALYGKGISQASKSELVHKWILPKRHIQISLYDGEMLFNNTRRKR